MSRIIVWQMFAGFALATTGCGGTGLQLAPPEPPLVTVEEVREQNLGRVSEFAGRLVAVEKQEIRSEVSGKIVEVKFKDGQVVDVGTILYEIDPTDYRTAVANATAMVAKSRSDVLTVEKQFVQAQGEFERAEASRNSLSKDEYEKRKTTFETSRVAIEAAKSALASSQALLVKADVDLARCSIRSAIHGVVSKTEITRGNYVSAGATRLTEVLRMDPIYAYFEVDEESSLRYRDRISKGEISESRKLPCWVGSRVDKKVNDKWPNFGYIDYIAPEISRSTGTSDVRAKIDNKRIGNDSEYRLSPGDSVRVQVEVVGEATNVITIPEIAVGSQQQQKFVYVVLSKDGKNYAEKRIVELGPVRDINGVRTQIIKSGLTKGERIIVNGLLRVRPGAEINIGPSKP